MMYQIFLTLRFLFYHLKCIRRDFLGKEQVQQLPGMDPILVVKTPTYFRKRPSGLSLPKDCLRSTWILTHGKWIKVEDRAHPVQQQDRFDQWVERACFQYHQSNDSEPTAIGSRYMAFRASHIATPGVTRTTRAFRYRCHLVRPTSRNILD